MDSVLGSRLQSGKGWLKRSDFNSLFEVLIEQNYEIKGPIIKDGAIVFDSVTSCSQLAFSVHDEQKPGQYKLVADQSNRYFNWHHGPQAIKPFLFKPEQPLWHCNADDTQLKFHRVSPEVKNLAIIGVRACDLAALAMQDKHFLHGDYQDQFYKAQRDNLLIIAVNCATSGSHCFCVSTGTGPEVSFYYDLQIDELADGFVIKGGSKKGLAILDKLALSDCTIEQLDRVKQQRSVAVSSQTRAMPDVKRLVRLKELLASRHWEEIAQRCFSCGNCTLVCPTCFCSKQESRNELSGSESGIASSQVRLWDSCFSLEHAHIFGKNYRKDTVSRYRQWMIHKLVSWQSQYGSIGCVGCGRCISWCPAEIDFLMEAQRLTDKLDNEPQARELSDE